MIKKFFYNYFELLFWIAGLTALGLTNPNGDPHFSLCPLKLMGFTWCPGCGLGHSISFLLHGNLAASFRAHSFGVPAFIIIVYRIFSLVRLRIKGQNEVRASYIAANMPAEAGFSGNPQTN